MEQVIEPDAVINGSLAQSLVETYVTASQNDILDYLNERGLHEAEDAVREFLGLSDPVSVSSVVTETE